MTEDIRSRAEAAHARIGQARRALNNGIISENEYLQIVNQLRADEGLAPLAEVTATVRGDAGTADSIDMLAAATIKRIEVLRPKDGDVLAIEYRVPLTVEQVERLSTAVNEHSQAAGRGQVLILLVENFGQIRTLDEGGMRTRGWVRAPE